MFSLYLLITIDNMFSSIVVGLLMFVMEIMETVVFVGSIFIVIYLFIVQPNQVKGASMEPTFQTGNYIFTSKITYKIRKPERGDVVVFHSPRNPDIEYIKRVIGLPGDTVKIENHEVFLNGNIINEPYISAKTEIIPGGTVFEGIPVEVTEGHLFVMGDNRPRSSDSREFGIVPIESIVGQVFFRYYPFNKLGKLNNPLPKALHSKNYLPLAFKLIEYSK